MQYLHLARTGFRCPHWPALPALNPYRPCIVMFAGYDQANPTSHELRFFKKFAEIFPVGFRPAGMLDDIILFQRRVGR